MSEGVADCLFLFLLCIAEPILLGICAQKIYDRAGAFWGIIALGMNIGLLFFFEGQRASRLVGDTAAEVGTVMSLSAIVVLAVMEILRNGPPASNKNKSAINLHRGLFRIWIAMFGPWTLFCALAARSGARRVKHCFQPLYSLKIA